MSNQHTPGPWYMSGEGIYHEQKKKAYESGTGARPVAFVHPINPDALANARLIAAAPDLLKALKAVHSEMGKRISTKAFDEFSEQTKDLIVAAIAKATGH